VVRALRLDAAALGAFVDDLSWLQLQALQVLLGGVSFRNGSLRRGDEETRRRHETTCRAGGGENDQRGDEGEEEDLGEEEEKGKEGEDEGDKGKEGDREDDEEEERGGEEERGVVVVVPHRVGQHGAEVCGQRQQRQAVEGHAVDHGVPEAPGGQQHDEGHHEVGEEDERPGDEGARHAAAVRDEPEAPLGRAAGTLLLLLRRRLRVAALPVQQGALLLHVPLPVARRHPA